MLKIAIIGSREYKSLDDVDEYLKNILLSNTDFRVITGGARGVDKRAEAWCQNNGIDCEVIRPINPKEKISYLFRNIEIITKANMVVAFYNGASRGTKFTINYAKKRHKPLKAINEPIMN